MGFVAGQQRGRGEAARRAGQAGVAPVQFLGRRALAAPGLGQLGLGLGGRGFGLKRFEAGRIAQLPAAFDALAACSRGRPARPIGRRLHFPAARQTSA